MNIDKAYYDSPHWRDFKRRYRESSLPQACLVCGNSLVDLHHVTTKRKWHEYLSDVVPLCRKHHRGVERIIEEHRIPLGDWVSAIKILKEESKWDAELAAHMVMRGLDMLVTRAADDNELYGCRSAAREISRTGVVCLCERPEDVIELRNEGIGYAVALYGKVLTDAQQVYLERSGADDVIVLINNEVAAIQIARQLGRSCRIHRPDLSDGLPTDFIRRVSS